MSEKSPEVLCYLCSIVDDSIKEERAIKFLNSAAENKVLGICEALKSRIKHVVVVSTGRGPSQEKGNRFSAVARRVSNVLVLYASFWQNSAFSHMVTALSLVMLLARVKRTSPGKRVCLIVYNNRNWMYLPALLFARIMNFSCYLDLEDAPVVLNSSLLKRLVIGGQVKIINGLCNQGAMYASSQLLGLTQHQHKLLCHGVAYKRVDAVLNQSEAVRPIRILYGGYLSEDTGAKLLIEAVRLLESRHKAICEKIQIIVTGKGPCLNDLLELSSNEGEAWIEFYGAVSFSTYQALLAGAHIGLCLKLPSSVLGATTFPSKVVEYASFGKAVLSTGLEDVVSLFGEDGAYFLNDESVEGLVNTMCKLALEPEKVCEVATLGQNRLIERSGKETVADNILKLLKVD